MATAQFLIHRRRRNETTVDNRIIWDRNLSNMARFALIAILSLREDWDYSVRGMAAMLEVSKDTMGKYLRELEVAGYLRRQQGGDKGRFSKSVYTITDTPGEFGDEEPPPCPKNYDSTCPNFSAPKKSPQQITYKGLNNNTPPTPQGGNETRKKRKRDPSTPKWKPEAFEKWWAYYRSHARGDDRIGAVKAWDKLKPDDALIRTMGLALMAQVKSEAWQRRNYVPYGATWLNHRRWEDPLPVDKPPEDDGPDVVDERRLQAW